MDSITKVLAKEFANGGTYAGELTGNRFGQRLEIENQSLQVDAVSGAAVSSKAYLKSLEKALNT